MNEVHAVLAVFFAGAFVQVLLVSRSLRDAMTAAALAVVFLGFPLLLARDLSTLFGGIFVFALLVSAFYPEQLLPQISAPTLLHYTILGVYAIYTTPNAELVLAVIAVPLGVIVVIALLLSVAFGLSAKSPERFLRLVAYVCYLFLVTVLIGGQLSLDSIEMIFDAEVLSLSQYLYIFVGGMVSLLFLSNVIYLLALFPLNLRELPWQLLEGSVTDAAREHKEFLRSKVSGLRISAFAAVLLLAHMAALVANYRWELVEPGLWINAAWVGLAMLSTVSEDEVVAHAVGTN